MHRVIAYGLSLSIIWMAGAADAKRAITPEDLYALQEVKGPKLSPDGRSIVFVVTTPVKQTNKTGSNLWIAATDGSKAPRALTDNAQASSHPEWRPDGKAIAFLSARPSSRDGAIGKVQVQLLPLDGGEARPLTNLKSSVLDFHWSPDGTRLVCVIASSDGDEPGSIAKSPNKTDTHHYVHSLIKMDAQGYFDSRRQHLWVVNVATGAAKQVTDGEDWHDTEPEWSPDGTRIVFTSNRDGQALDGSRHADIWTVAADGGPLTKISNHDVAGWPDYGFSPMHHAPHWSPDGKTIAFFAMREEGGSNEIWIALSNGQGSAHLLFKDIDELTNDFRWTRSGLYYAANAHGTRQIYRVDPREGKVSGATEGDRTISAFDASDDGEIAFVADDFRTPGELFSTNRKFSKERRLTALNQALFDQLDLPELSRMTYQSADGLRIEGFLAKPYKFDPGRKYPMVLSLHGGPDGMFGYDWMPLHQVLVGDGYAVFYVNPRGSSGYGHDFLRAVNLEWGGKAYDDVMAGVDAVTAQNPWIDPTRLGVQGASYGGFMTNWIISHTTRFAAAIPTASISDFVSIEGTRDIFYSHRNDFGGDLFQNFDLYWKYSPLRYAANVKTPTLILHGEADQRVPIEQAEQWFRALKHFNVAAELVTFPREPHTGTRKGETEHVIESLHWTEYWFDKYLNHNNKALAPDAVKPGMGTERASGGGAAAAH